MQLVTNNCDCEETDFTVNDVILLARLLETVENGNDNHGPDGRFSSGGNGPQSSGGGSAAFQARKAEISEHLAKLKSSIDSMGTSHQSDKAALQKATESHSKVGGVLREIGAVLLNPFATR